MTAKRSSLSIPPVRSGRTGSLRTRRWGSSSTATIHGGQETTIITSLVALLHLGLVFARHALQAALADPDHRRYQRLDLRPRHLGRLDTSRQPVEDELTTARNLVTVPRRSPRSSRGCVKRGSRASSPRPQPTLRKGRSGVCSRNLKISLHDAAPRWASRGPGAS